MHGARLDHGVTEHRPDRIGQPGQAVTAADQDVPQPPVPQIGQHFGPELGALVGLDPDPQSMLAAIDVDTDDQMRRPLRDDAVVADLEPDPVDIHDRIHRIDRAGLPRLDLIFHHIGHPGDQVR